MADKKNTISNEQKARELAIEYENLCVIDLEDLALKAMRWKDEQHAKEKQQWIEKAINFLEENLYTHKVEGNVGVNYVRTKDDMNVTQTELMYLFTKAIEV